MLLRNVRTLLLALFVAGCGKDQGILEPKNVVQATEATANSSPGFGRVVTSLTINGSAAPATVSASANQMLAVVVGGFTTMDQVITSWLSTSVTFTAISDGSVTRRCNDIDVWTSMVMPGSNLSVSFSAQAPSVFDSYIVTVQAHQEDTCSAVFPSEPFPSGADQITLNVVPSNTAPVLASIGDQSVDENANLTFNASATDSDVPAQTLQFSLDNAATGFFPAGATMTPTGEFSWTPNEAQGPGTYRVKVIVSDGALTDDEEIQLTVGEVNAAPALTLPPDIITQWGMAVPNVSATASDSDLPAGALTFAKVSGPSWVQVD
ncbi:MAG: Ig-like domain-containing protein, partial [Gemmatimonadaceae bacterium]